MVSVGKIAGAGREIRRAGATLVMGACWSASTGVETSLACLGGSMEHEMLTILIARNSGARAPGFKRG